MPHLTVYSTTYDPDNIYDGELGDEARTDEEIIDCTSDEFDSAVDIAIRYLSSEGITQTSTSPYPRTGSMAGIWFIYIGGSYCSNYYTGEHTEESAHPEGFTDEEIREICYRLHAR